MTRFTRTIQVALFVSGAVVVIVLVQLTIPRIRAQNTQLIPYTVVLDERIIGKDGNQKPGPRQTWAMRSDGSQVLVLEGGRTIQFATGLKVVTNDKRRAKSTTRIHREHRYAWVLDVGQNCMKTITGHDGRLNQTVGGTEIIDNLRTIKIVAGKTTSWFALDFGCARIRQRMDFGPDGASELDLVTLLPGEPSQELFAIPDDYKEGPPSTLATVKCSPPCSQENLRKYFERLDMSYSTHRAY